MQAVIKKCAHKRLTELNTHNKRRAEGSSGGSGSGATAGSKGEDGLVSHMAASSMSVLTGVAQVGRESPGRIIVENGPNAKPRDTKRSLDKKQQQSFINRVLRLNDRKKSQSASQLDRLIAYTNLSKIQQHDLESSLSSASIDDNSESNFNMEIQPLIKSPSLNDLRSMDNSGASSKQSKASSNKTGAKASTRGIGVDAMRATANAHSDIRPFYDDVLFPKVYNRGLYFSSDGYLVTDDQSEQNRRRSHSSGSSTPRRRAPPSASSERRWSSVKDRVSGAQGPKVPVEPRRALDDSMADCAHSRGALGQLRSACSFAFVSLSVAI